jgi:hypothetical protein
MFRFSVCSSADSLDFLDLWAAYISLFLKIILGLKHLWLLLWCHVFTMASVTYIFFNFKINTKQTFNFKTILFYTVALHFSVIVTIISRSRYDNKQENRIISYSDLSFNNNFILCYIFLYRLCLIMVAMPDIWSITMYNKIVV